MSPKKSKRSCKKCGILIRDHHHAKAGRFCTGPPWPAPTPSPDPPAAADSPQIPDLETLQQQREDLQSAIQRARLAREVRDLEADLRALQLDITSGKPVNSPPATPEKQLPGATPPVPPPANQTPPPSEQTPADHTPPPPPPPAQTTTTQMPPPPAPTPPIVPPPAPAPAGTPPPANLQELRQHPQIQAAMQELTSSSLALDDLLSRPTTVPATSTVPASTPSPAAPLRRIDQDPQIYLATNTGHPPPPGLATTLERNLDAEISAFRASTFADSTKSTYGTHLRAYLQFCLFLGYPPVPATTEIVCRYAAFLARSLTYTSVRQYLNIVSLLHKEFGLPNPTLQNWQLHTVLRGIRRFKGDTPRRKLPITPTILLGILSTLDLSLSVDATFWAACLVAFFCLFRKANLVPSSKNAFSASKHLSRCDFKLSAWGFTVTCRFSKTIQFGERLLEIPLPAIPGSPLCPCAALTLAFSKTRGALPDQSAFLYSEPTGSLTPLTYPKFLRKLRSSLSALGFKPSLYAGHSFRRGGASYLLECGVPLDLIKIMGDWKSDSVFVYLAINLQGRLTVMNKMGQRLRTLL
ncbi:uncharacterized protein LOC144883111 [Branchiostoma floridae x Branchiostoma japonicum]